ELVALYEKVVAIIPDVQRKGAGTPYTSLNGHMFSYLAESGTMALRLPEPVRSDFIEKYKTHLMEAYGIVQKEYVAVPGELLVKTDELGPYIVASFEYIRRLKPKPGKKDNTS